MATGYEVKGFSDVGRIADALDVLAADRKLDRIEQELNNLGTGPAANERRELLGRRRSRARRTLGLEGRS